ncbi:uncharacterized protein M421DRAFT_310040 [Didymella exigua CBS 183.55]|uniref:Uncharacterized protein n=1 Tax=Didymella exigua CBS 183.55 TaxID=1150837 RepID=A0A6A5R8R7_9PLEO|nr:uncharacterized protein M421DRAFT_310040 [Didymella exigua CBS 183.55]KAF1923610.1 hypothetical protein M421DRAFT_310040 [Didymella exigua CBS 183.55]
MLGECIGGCRHSTKESVMDGHCGDFGTNVVYRAVVSCQWRGCFYYSLWPCRDVSLTPISCVSGTTQHVVLHSRYSTRHASNSVYHAPASPTPQLHDRLPSDRSAERQERVPTHPTKLPSFSTTLRQYLSVLLIVVYTFTRPWRRLRPRLLPLPPPLGHFKPMRLARKSRLVVEARGVARVSARLVRFGGLLLFTGFLRTRILRTGQLCLRSGFALHRVVAD